MSRKSNLDQTQQRPQLCTGSRNPGVVSLPQLPPEYHCNRDRNGWIIPFKIQSLKTNYFYRCIAMIFPNATDVQQNREYQPFQKIQKIDIEKFTNIWKLTVCPFSWVPRSCLESESCGQQPECWPPEHGRLHQPPAELPPEESKNPEVQAMSDTVVLLIYTWTSIFVVLPKFTVLRMYVMFIDKNGQNNLG